MSDRVLQARVAESLDRATDWLTGLAAGDGAYRMSAAHDPNAYPGTLLVGTYDVVLCLGLLNAIERVDTKTTARFLLRHRLPDGRFANPDMRAEDCFKREGAGETRRYIDFHVTNYALGALDYLTDEPAVLTFIEPFLSDRGLHNWLDERDLRDPWLEGNNIVNLGSFFELAARQKDVRAVLRLRELLDWHLDCQDPTTGFWLSDDPTDANVQLHAMAGATHNLHLFWAFDEPLPYCDRMMAYCLSLPTEASTACLDVDPIDIIIHLYRLYGLEPDRAPVWLSRKLDSLLDFQNADGGFPDDLTGTRKLDGWIKGYEEPQGLSNAFATYFRCLAIAMIADTLWPGWRPFRFRKMLGIGYAQTRWKATA